MYKGQFKWLKRRERKKLRRINKQLWEAEQEYERYNTSIDYIENLTRIFSEIFGEKIIFVDRTSKMK